MKSPMPFDPADRDAKRLIIDQASQFREALVGESRSGTLVHLFDYLLERSSDLRAPKEIEIAMAVFGKGSDFDTSQDSTVRVHIHRLRQRLERYYAGKNGMRLLIPKGEYRLILSDEWESADEDAHLEQPQFAPGRKPFWKVIVVGVVATGVLWTTLVFGDRRESSTTSSLGQTSFWKPIADHERLPLIAAGDFYLVAESGAEGKVQRLSMYPTINSERDLDDYLKVHPDKYNTLRDRDVHRVPARVATGAAAILPVVAAVRPDRGVAKIIPASEISQEAVDSNNVIYIEYFSELGILQSPVLNLSHFELGSDFNQLKDIPSGRIYRARGASANILSDGSTAKQGTYSYDYGYIASFTGPSGNQTIVIAGIEDSALSQMIKLVSDKRQLDVLSSKTGGAEAFEALYQIRSTGGLIFDTNLIIARALRTAKSKDISP